jgi:hypothetical protein
MVDLFELVAARLADADRLAAEPLCGRPLLLSGSNATGVSARISRTFPKLRARSLPSPPIQRALRRLFRA